MSRYRKDTLVWRTIEAGVLRSTSSKTTPTNQDLGLDEEKERKSYEVTKSHTARGKTLSSGLSIGSSELS